MGLADPNKVNYQVLLEGEEVVNILLGLSVATEVNRVPRARLEFNYRLLEKNEGNQEDFVLEDSEIIPKPPKRTRADFMPGKKVEIQLSRGAGVALETVFEGYITQQNIQAKSSGKLILTVECRHYCQKMTLHERTRFHHHDANNGASDEEVAKVKEEDVLEKLLEYYSDDQLKLELPDTSQLSVEHDNMMQYNCSDWDFLVIRAEALGYVCLPEADKMKLLIPKVKPVATETLELGKDIFEYEAMYDETSQGEVQHLATWDMEKTERFYENKKNLEVTGDYKQIQSDVTVNYGGELSKEEASLWLNNEELRQQRALIQAQLKIKGTEKIKVDDTIAISGFDSVWDRDTYVSGVKHVLKNGEWYSWLQCGISKTPHAKKYNIGVKEIPFVPKVDGLLYGKVVSYKKNEAGYEMIEVEVPAYNKEEGTRTIYARHATFSAGKNGGAVFRPYKGDEVVIGFIDNDPRFPVVLGALYTSENEPDYEWKDTETQEEVGFTVDEWKFSIQQEDKVLKIESPDEHQFIIDNSDQAHISMIFDSDNSIKVEDSGITIAGKSITLESQQGDIKISGKSIEASSNSGVKIEANSQLELEGKVTASLKGQITQIN